MEELLTRLIEELGEEEVRKIILSPLKWAETFLVTPSTLQPFVANYVEQKILTADGQRVVIRVHRRAGKTYSLVVLALYYCLTMAGSEVLVIGPQKFHVDQIFDPIRDFISANEWIEDYKKNDSRSPARISFVNGSKIVGRTTGAKQKGKGLSVRGQGADLIIIDEAAYLGEDDWDALRAIFRGDEYRKRPPRTFVASTPKDLRGTYYEICKHPVKSKYWQQIHVSLEENPDVPQEKVRQAKDESNSKEYTLEYLAEFPEVGYGVFPKNLVEASYRHYNYLETKKYVENLNAQGILPIRTMGVDWDKKNRDGHGPNIVILELVADKKYRLLYRYEIPQSELSLTRAVKKVIELNDIFNPQWIYIDLGFGEYQHEELLLHGRKFPHTGLDKKVVGISFANSIKVNLPTGGQTTKRFKDAMINLLVKWFEDGKIELSSEDTSLHKDLVEYHEESRTETGVKYSGENDHSIAALGLAGMAMLQKVTRPYESSPATKCYVVPAPEPVPVRKKGTLGRVQIDSKDPGRSFTRGRLGYSPPMARSKF